MKIKQEERKKKTPKRKKKQQQQQKSRSGQRTPSKKQSYRVHMLAGQAKDTRIKDLEAELAAMKMKLSVEGQVKDLRIKDLEAELAALKKDRWHEGFFKRQYKEDMEAELAAMKKRLLAEQHAKLEAMAKLESCKKERDKSDALASKSVAKKVPGSWNA